ncbi:MAG: 30S ribosomal protein S19e [Candidatus Woesearchaeota archaeon]
MIYTVDQQQLVLALAQELKNHIEMPQWAQFVKTGSHRETLPRNADWWYIRAASILRLCYKQGPIGVNKLRTRYGGKKNRGVRPDKFELASGKVIRVILQQLQEAKLVEQVTVKTYKGRKATAQGATIISKSAKTVAKNSKTSKQAQKETTQTKAPAKKSEAKETKKATEKSEDVKPVKEEK